MQVVGELVHGVYGRLVDAGWAWCAHEEEWDEFPDGTMVLLLARAGRSRFMLKAVPYAPAVGVRVWGPGNEARDDFAAEVLVDGERWLFRFLRHGTHWAALHDLPPSNLLYVVASNIEPSEVELAGSTQSATTPDRFCLRQTPPRRFQEGLLQRGLAAMPLLPQGSATSPGCARLD